MKKLTHATLQTIKLKLQNYSSKVSIDFSDSPENQQDSSVLLTRVNMSDLFIFYQYCSCWNCWKCTLLVHRTTVWL